MSEIKSAERSLAAAADRRTFLQVLVFIFLIALLIFSTGCAKEEVDSQQAGAIQEETASTVEDPSEVQQQESVEGQAVEEEQRAPFILVKGVSLSPRSFDQAGLLDFVDKAKEAGTMVSWIGDWDDLAESDGAPSFLVSMASRFDYAPLVQAQPFDQGTGRFIRPFDDEAKQQYKDSAVAFVKKTRPDYFGMGVEVNVFQEKNSEGFDEFVVFYNDVYDALKAASPDTKVFPSFQLERLRGLHGGLYGGWNDESNSEWELIDMFSSDVVAFTTYPGLIYKSPSEIPEDYYEDILAHTDKPVVFTEVGWHTADSPKGWEGSAEEQADFVELFIRSMPQLRPGFVIWSFVYDPDTVEPFNSMGLIDDNGKERPAWDVWVNGK